MYMILGQINRVEAVCKHWGHPGVVLPMIDVLLWVAPFRNVQLAIQR